jgi:hypothetical protein
MVHSGPDEITDPGWKAGPKNRRRLVQILTDVPVTRVA